MSFVRTNSVPPTKLDIERRQRMILDELERAAKDAIRRHTPKDTGTLQDYMLNSSSKQSNTRGGASLSLVDLSQTDIERPAPKNTIYRFLRMYRNVQDGKRLSKLGSRKRPWPGAWWFLKDDEYSTLRLARTGGAVGGPLPPPKYLGALEKGLVPDKSRGTVIVRRTQHRGFLGRIRSTMQTSYPNAIARGLSR